MAFCPSNHLAGVWGRQRRAVPLMVAAERRRDARPLTHRACPQHADSARVGPGKSPSIANLRARLGRDRWAFCHCRPRRLRVEVGPKHVVDHRLAGGRIRRRPGHRVVLLRVGCPNRRGQGHRARWVRDLGAHSSSHQRAVVVVVALLALHNRVTVRLRIRSRARQRKYRPRLSIAASLRPKPFRLTAPAADSKCGMVVQTTARDQGALASDATPSPPAHRGPPATHAANWHDPPYAMA